MLFGYDFKSSRFSKEIDDIKSEFNLFGTGFFNKGGMGDESNKTWDAYLLLIVLSGDGVFEYIDENKKYYFQAGSFFQVFPQQKTCLISENDCDLSGFFITIPTSLFNLLKSVNTVNNKKNDWKFKHQ